MRLSATRAALSALMVTGTLAIAPCVSAQTSFISPVQAQNVEGPSGNVFPWSNNAMRRYQQVHSDVNMPLLIRSMSWRQDGTTANNSGVRQIDCEVFMGYSNSYAEMSTTFGANYLPGTKTLVMAQKIINMGPQGPGGFPSPFMGMDVMLDQVFVYVPGRSLIWEAVIYNNPTVAGFGAIDADVSVTSINRGSLTGIGCTATGQTAAMELYQFDGASDMGGVFTFACGVQRAPALAPCFLTIGFANPHLVAPGVICGGVYTSSTILIQMGAADATGLINYFQGFSLSIRNTIGGLGFFAQMHALDPGLSQVVKIANSNGYRFQVPLPDTSREIQVSRMQNNTNTTTDPRSSFFQTSTIGYGIVTRFNQ